MAVRRHFGRLPAGRRENRNCPRCHLTSEPINRSFRARIVRIAVRPATRRVPMVVLRYPFQVAVLAAAVGLAPIRAGSPVAPAPVRVNQPVQEYFTPFGVDTTPADRGTYGTQFTHLGTDFGAMGPEGGRIGWAEGGAARVDLTKAEGWAGLWHSLAGAG